MSSITMRSLLEAGIHFGHQTRRWNPKMARYIFGERHGIYIIDLQKTIRQMQKAYVTVREVTASGGKVLFVGTKKQAREAVQREAERCGMYYVNHRWLGGTLTNWQTIQRSIRNLVRLEDLEASGKIEQFKKKEATMLRKQREKLDRNLCGIKNMDGPPQIMFVVDSHRETIAVREADRLDIPCIAIVDTNADPDAVPIPIPGNDDAIRAVGLFCEIIADAAIEGRGAFEKKHQEEEDKKKAAFAEATTSDKVARLQAKFGDEDAEAETVEEESEAGDAAAEPAAVAASEGEAAEDSPADPANPEA